MNLELYSPAPGVRVNLVQSIGGVFVDDTGSSRGISNDLDRELLLYLRTLSDVVVTDGETARREKYRVPRVCDLAVITREGYEPEPRESGHKYLQFPGLSPAQVVSELQKLGYSRILLEVGPNLVRELIQANLVDQLCLTNTNGSVPELRELGAAGWRSDFELLEGDTRFSAWSPIPH